MDKLWTNEYHEAYYVMMLRSKGCLLCKTSFESLSFSNIHKSRLEFLDSYDDSAYKTLLQGIKGIIDRNRAKLEYAKDVSEVSEEVVISILENINFTVTIRKQYDKMYSTSRVYELDCKLVNTAALLHDYNILQMSKLCEVVAVDPVQMSRVIRDVYANSIMPKVVQADIRGYKYFLSFFGHFKDGIDRDSNIMVLADKEIRDKILHREVFFDARNIVYNTMRRGSFSYKHRIFADVSDEIVLDEPSIKEKPESNFKKKYKIL